jgi:hypothetical protein
MNKLIGYILLLLSGCFSGCQIRPSHSTNLEHAHGSDDEESVVLAHEQISRAPVRDLENKALKGDGAAAFKLFWFFAGTGHDRKLMDQYLNMALRLEDPDALYYKAFMLWSREPEPDIALVEKLLKKAFDRGCLEDRSLLVEVVAARESGHIPAESKFRNFPRR